MNERCFSTLLFYKYVNYNNFYISIFLYADRREKCVYETTSIQNNCRVLEIQHFEPDPEQNDFSEEDSGSDSQPEVSRFKRLFIEDRFSDESKIESLKQDAILQVNAETNGQESDNEAYEVANGAHVTGKDAVLFLLFFAVC